MSKWIAGTDQKTKISESELKETNTKSTHKHVEESLLDLAGLSTYSIENSESEIPRPSGKKRKVSFVEDTSPRTDQRVTNKPAQSKASGKEKYKTEDLRYRRSRITPERKTLFRLANTKINKTKYESDKDCPTQTKKEKHEDERADNTPNSGTHHKQYSQHNQNARQNKTETSSHRKSAETPENRFERREKTSSSDRHSERKTIINRRSLDYSIQLNPTRTSTIFTHKRDLVKRGYTLRETTAEERGHRRDDLHNVRVKRRYETNEKETRKTSQITPITERRSRTKRKFNLTLEKDERKESEDRRKSRETLDQSGSKKKNDKERAKTRENSLSQDSWTRNDKKSQRPSPRKPKGPLLTQITREQEKRTTYGNVSTQMQTKKTEKNLNKWPWIPSALTRYVRK
ncbi:pre-mRNA-splicing factor 38B-like [Ambystoma mexicanum]|uniref:pre-mRNA-splicing factor 38B-like n=1 Tax=Ambystoma mexicanum TaxID=8296 RepID=UPI0037E7370D